jgi:hypothetical protein
MKIYLLILIIIIACIVGYLVFVKETSAPGIQSQIYNGATFSVDYPTNWVIQNHGCTDMGGADCTQLAPVAAIKYYQLKYGNDSLSLAYFSAYKTDQTPQEWLDTIGAGSFAEDNQISINGYPATFEKTILPNAYTDYYYAVADQGTIVYFTFRSYDEGQPYGTGHPIEIDDYSQYLPAFQSIVNSIKFK